MPLSTIYFSFIAAVHMIGQSKMNERLHDMTLNEILLDLSVSEHLKFFTFFVARAAILKFLSLKRLLFTFVLN